MEPEERWTSSDPNWSSRSLPCIADAALASRPSRLRSAWPRSSASPAPGRPDRSCPLHRLTGRARCRSASPTIRVVRLRCAAVAPFGFRYQYLAGGVNTGSGWSTWNPNGTFASMYAQDSWAHGVIPVFTYYMLLQSKPGGGDEAHADLTNLRDAATMSAYWADVKLLFSRIRGSRPVVVHVEPDLWGYLEQAGDVGPRVVVRATVGEAPRRGRAQRDPRLPHERLGHEARHRLRRPARRHRPSLRSTVSLVLPLVARAASTSPSRISPTAMPASMRSRAATRARGSHLPTSAATSSTPRRSCASPACGWSPGRSRSETPSCGR